MLDEETRQLVATTADEAARRAVQETLIKFGIDPSSPLLVQRDMAFLREVRSVFHDPETQRDLIHLRRWRRTMDGIQSKGLLTIIGLLATGITAATWLGIKELIHLSK